MRSPANSDSPLIAAIILTKNEERDLPGCLESLQGVVAEVYVIDSGSTDNTLQIARDYGATLLLHEFENYARQFNWALDNISTKAAWVLRIDADESLHPKLAKELLDILPDLSSEVTGIEVARRIRFMGRDILHGDMYPVWLLRLWRRGVGRCEDRWMDEYIELTKGRKIRVRGDLLHNIPKSLTEWTDKHNGYAERECIDIRSIEPTKVLAGDKGSRRRLKESVYLRMPLFYRAFAYWFYRYFLKLGFLDGQVGLIYHFLHGFWYRFLVDAKVYEEQYRKREPA